MEEMYKRTLQEVGSLREQLGRSGPVAPDNTPCIYSTLWYLLLACVWCYAAERKEYARQSRASEEVMRERVQEVREMVHEEQISKKDIAEGNNYIFRGSFRGRS